ncbi:nose resistant to fluoxetine protein 6 [Anabrus simplex]|uniref:nose resistant to fluoxetine protein 6 n=1 Tax=Anabrus simplex TaxID=316456 RepID=UPI0035A2CDCF
MRNLSHVVLLWSVITAVCGDELIQNFVPYNITLLQHAVDHVQGEGCRTQVMEFIEGIRNMSTRALQMLDASGKPGSGLLHGNLRHLGDFDQCMATHGQYCLARLLPTPGDALWDNLVQTVTAGRTGYELPVGTEVSLLLPHFGLLEWAVCTPTACSPQDVERGLNAALNVSSVSLKVFIQPRSCYRHTMEDFSYRVGDYIMMSIFLITGLFVLAGSIYHKKINFNNKPGRLGELLLAFSWPKNWSRLWSTSSPPGAINCLDGVRAFSILWVVMHHKLLLIAKAPAANKLFLIKELKKVENMLLINSVNAVDSFLLVSGLLRAYNMLGSMDKGKFYPVREVLQRYCRLTPAYGVMIGFYATLLVYLGTGPAWNTYMKNNSEWCQLNWLWNVLYVNNYIAADKLCILQSWYLSADMQLFLLAPLIVYPMWRWPRIGKVLLGVLILISILVPFLITYVYQYPGIFGTGLHNTVIVTYSKYVYFTTHNRMSPYLVGMSLGYVFHKIGDEPLKLAKVWVILGWCCSLTVVIAVVFGPYRLMQETLYSQLESSIYGGLHHLAWGTAWMWVVFACHKGYGGPVNSLLSAKVFRPIGRLTYGIYLTHLVVLMYNNATLRTAPYLTTYYLKLVQGLLVGVERTSNNSGSMVIISEFFLKNVNHTSQSQNAFAAINQQYTWTSSFNRLSGVITSISSRQLVFKSQQAHVGHFNSHPSSSNSM